MRQIRIVLTVTMLLFLNNIKAAPLATVFVGLDAEFGLKQSTSAQAIEQGILIARDEINRAGGVLGGRPLGLVSRDNRAVTTRFEAFWRARLTAGAHV